jgi:hypothetical protein
MGVPCVTNLFTLRCFCTTGGDRVSLESSCVLLVDYIVVSGILDEDIMEIYLPS